ncbi:hypothetical protein CCR91_21205 [Thiorhodovibrio winogradskyi]|nr:hypothetical protein [Thiorhodovibrio winogradskyi]
MLQRQAPTLIVSPRGEDALLLRQLESERVPITVLTDRVDTSLNNLVTRPRSGWRETVLELPAEDVLTRSLSLPAQVKAGLRKVIGYELGRLTPFNSQEVYYDVFTEGTRPRGGQLNVRLALCRRDLADHWLERLRQLGSPAARLCWQGAWDGANMLPDAQRSRRGSYGWLINIMLLLLICALLAAVMNSPVRQKREQLEQLTGVLQGLRADAEQVPTIREELESARAGSVAVLNRKAAQPRMIDLLRELTERLPDNTWVQTVNYRNEDVDVRGESGQATELLNILEQAPGISEVTFRSPVMQVSQTGKERFHIAFQYRRASP